MPDNYQVIAEVSVGELKARITKRRSNIGVTQFSYKLYRVFPQGGEMRETPWLNPRHLPDMEKLVAEIGERIQLEKDAEGRYD